MEIIEMDGDQFVIDIESVKYTDPCHPRWADCWEDVVGGYEIYFRAWCDGELVTDQVILQYLEQKIIDQIKEQSDET